MIKRSLEKIISSARDKALYYSNTLSNSLLSLLAISFIYGCSVKTLKIEERPEIEDVRIRSVSVVPFPSSFKPEDTAIFYELPWDSYIVSATTEAKVRDFLNDEKDSVDYTIRVGISDTCGGVLDTTSTKIAKKIKRYQRNRYVEKRVLSNPFLGISPNDSGYFPVDISISVINNFTGASHRKDIRRELPKNLEQFTPGMLYVVEENWLKKHNAKEITGFLNSTIPEITEDNEFIIGDTLYLMVPITGVNVAEDNNQIKYGIFLTNSQKNWEEQVAIKYFYPDEKMVPDSIKGGYSLPQFSDTGIVKVDYPNSYYIVPFVVPDSLASSYKLSYFRKLK